MNIANNIMNIDTCRCVVLVHVKNLTEHSKQILINKGNFQTLHVGLCYFYVLVNEGSNYGLEFLLKNL